MEQHASGGFKDMFNSAFIMVAIIIPIFLLITFKEPYIEISDVKIRKPTALYILQLLKGLIILIVVFINGKNSFLFTVLSFLFLFCVYYDVKVRVKAIDSLEDISGLERKKLMSEGRKLYFYVFPYILIWTILLFWGLLN